MTVTNGRPEPEEAISVIRSDNTVMVGGFGLLRNELGGSQWPGLRA